MNTFLLVWYQGMTGPPGPPSGEGGLYKQGIGRGGSLHLEVEAGRGKGGRLLVSKVT